jgi:hypothetical protein
MRPGVDALRQVIRALMLAASKRSSAGVVMLRAALVVTSLLFGIEINAEPMALADPTYRNCNERTPTGVTASRSVTPPTDRISTSTAMVSPASHLRGADRHGESVGATKLSVPVLIIGPR